MSSADDIDRSIKKLRFTTRAATDERILADASAALAEARRTSLEARQSSVWRIIMKSHWTKLGAAAAVIVAAAVLFPIALDETAAPAYAIEQTIEANRAVRAIQVSFEPAGGGVGEMWAQFDDGGGLIRLRMDFPNTPGDGPKVVIWEDDKAKVWFKRKKTACIVHERNTLRQMPPGDRQAFFNPKAAGEELLEARAREDTCIETTEPSAPGDPITLTVTKGGQDEVRLVFQVDPETKLLRQIEKHERKGDTYVFRSRVKYVAYNASVDPNAFVLDIPDDVLCVDQTDPEIGLAKGDLTSKQIAAKVAREFFVALIAKDYLKAGRLLGGPSAGWMKKTFGGVTYVRVVSVGEAARPPKSKGLKLMVTCEVELERDGVKKVEKYDVYVRPTYSLPGRWAISGGDFYKNL